MKKVLIPKIKSGSGFEFFDMGNGKYLYQEDRRKEIIDEEKLKKIGNCGRLHTIIIFARHSREKAI